jgi:uncharacterized membrane protein
MFPLSCQTREKERTFMNPQLPYNYRPLVAAGMLLGLGLGGFFDGIVFHQLLQTHNMLSAVIPKTNLVNVEVNMFWDGLFHAFTWLMTVWGVSMLFKAGKHVDVPWSSRTFVGSLLLGWGAFNFVEGIVDHYLLQVHHVVERLGLSIFDAAFVASGVVLLLAGTALIRSGKRSVQPHPWRPGMTQEPA